MNGARVVVTGASGFIGSHLVRRLVGVGARVHAVTRITSDLTRLSELETRIRIHHAELCDAVAVKSMMAEASPDYVFNLATYRALEGAADYRRAIAVNLEGLLNLLEHARRARRFVHFGSSTEYRAQTAAMSESTPLQPNDVHGMTKAAATLLALQYAAAQDVPVTVLRLFHVYGPADRPTRFLPRVLAAAMAGETLHLTAPGYRHDWTYIDDVIDAVLAAATTDRADGEIFNIASGRDWTNEDIVECVSKLTGRRIALADAPYPHRPWDRPHWTADVSKACALLPWRAVHTLEAGLRKTIDAYSAYAY